MEVAALAALLAVGYVLTNGSKPTVIEESKEGFEQAIGDGSDDLFVPNGGQPPPAYEQVRTSPGYGTVPGKPRQPSYAPEGQLDQYYNLPSGGTLSSNPIEQPDLYPRNLLFASPSMAPQAPQTAVTAQVRFNVPGIEQPPNYNSGKTVISALTGLPMSSDEFTHNNMVPFFRGSVKQNMTDDSNTSALDNMIGTGFNQIEKREQAPLFDPQREPMGNVTGLENMTDFMQDRMIVSSNRANETPIEATRVGPGLGQGYSSLPIGGFQQMEVLEVARRNLSVDELRAASNPKLTFEGVIIPGKAIGTQRGDIGEVRKYHPDKFFLNENGERNFVTANADNLRPTTRSDQVMKFQARSETSTPIQGPAGPTDSKQTYTVPSFRAPFVRQHDGYGYRNADGSAYGVSDTDATNNDFGAAAYELPVNQRNVISERGQALNLVTAGVPQAMQAYDPNDIARPTVRETTGETDWIGSATAVDAKKLTVYDPNDIARTTVRETTGSTDWIGSAVGVEAKKLTVYDPDDIARTTVRETTGANDWIGSAVGVEAKKLTVYDPNDIARTTVRETTGETDWVGVATGVEAKKLIVYDPTDIPRITLRNTNAEVDTALNVTRAGVPGARTMQFPDGWKPTSKSVLSANSSYTGAAGQARAKGEQVYDTAYAMRQNGMKESTAAGRQPMKGNGILPTFNGEDNVNMTFRKLTNDVLNDRDNTVNRVVGPTAGVEAIGLMRPKQVLSLNISKERNMNEILDMLDDNPYALPVYKLAAGGPAARDLRGNEGPAEMGLRSLTSRY